MLRSLWKPWQSFLNNYFYFCIRIQIKLVQFNIFCGEILLTNSLNTQSFILLNYFKKSDKEKKKYGVIQWVILCEKRQLWKIWWKRALNHGVLCRCHLRTGSSSVWLCNSIWIRCTKWEDFQWECNNHRAQLVHEYRLLYIKQSL